MFTGRVLRDALEQARGLSCTVLVEGSACQTARIGRPAQGWPDSEVAPAGKLESLAPGHGVQVASVASTQARPRLEPFVWVRAAVPSCIIRSRVWVGALVRACLRYRAAGVRGGSSVSPRNSTGSLTWPISGGRTQDICQDGLYGAAGGGRVDRHSQRPPLGPVRDGSRRSGRWPGRAASSVPSHGWASTWRAGCGPRRPGPHATHPTLPGGMLAEEDRVDHADRAVRHGCRSRDKGGRPRPERRGHPEQGDRLKTLPVGQGDRGHDDLRQIGHARPLGGLA